MTRRPGSRRKCANEPWRERRFRSNDVRAENDADVGGGEGCFDQVAAFEVKQAVQLRRNGRDDAVGALGDRAEIVQALDIMAHLEVLVADVDRSDALGQVAHRAPDPHPVLRIQVIEQVPQVITQVGVLDFGMNRPMLQRVLHQINIIARLHLVETPEETLKVQKQFSALLDQLDQHKGHDTKKE